MKVISIHGEGQNPGDLYLDACPRPEVGRGFVLIRTSFAGVNRPDVLQRRGHYPPPPGASPILGLEVSGLIEEMNLDPANGDDVAWKVGDAVCALVNGGGYAEFVAVDVRHLLRIPTGLTLAQAASLPENVLTVYANLMEHGRFQSEETVLVHGANSGIGSMTVMMGKAFGGKVIATARGAKKCAFARNLGADLVIDTQSEDFVPAVKALGGADVVLDIVGGDYVARNLACLAHKGRLVQVGFGKTSSVDIDLRRIMQKQAVLTGSMLRPRSFDEKARITAAVALYVWPLIDNGQIKPVIDKIYDFADAAQAHTYLEGGEHMGKVVLSL